MFETLGADSFRDNESSHHSNQVDLDESKAPGMEDPEIQSDRDVERIHDDKELYAYKSETVIPTIDQLDTKHVVPNETRTLEHRQVDED